WEGPSRLAAEGERGGGGVRRVGRIRRDARRGRRGRVDRPCIAGGRPGVSGRVRLAHLERVRACREAAVALRTGARGEPCAVELASKGSSRFTAERERRGGGVRRVGRIRSDARRSRRRRVDRPCIARRRPRVSGRVRLTYLERVRAVGQARIALRGRAGRESATVELAAERRSRLPREGEGGGGGV